MRKNRIVYIQYTNPAGYPSLEHSSRLFANAEWMVVFLGTGAEGAASLEFSDTKGVRVLKMPFCRPGWRQKIHYAAFCLWSVAYSLFWRPDWVYASDPHSAPPALAISFFGFKIIYHEHDSLSPGDGEGGRLNHIVVRIRNLILKRASIVIFPNEERIAQTCSANRSEVFIVWNCPGLEEVVAHKRSEKGTLSVTYHGSIVPDRLPITVLQALALLPEEVTLTVVGYQTVGHRDYVQEMRDFAERLGVAPRVRFLGAIPTRKQMLECCRKADVGLALMPKKSRDINVTNMVGASNKPFDYLACGLAILVSDLADWRETYVTPGYGMSCNPEDPESIANALAWFLNNPELTKLMGERGRQRVLTNWNYEYQFSTVFSMLTGRSEVQKSAHNATENVI